MSEIDQLFEQAATLTGDERSQFLDGLTVVQRRAVEKLLAAAASLDNHGSFLQGEPDDATLPPRANPDDEVTIPPDVDIENEATLVPDQSNTVAIPGASPVSATLANTNCWKNWLAAEWALCFALGR